MKIAFIRLRLKFQEHSLRAHNPHKNKSISKLASAPACFVDLNEFALSSLSDCVSLSIGITTNYDLEMIYTLKKRQHRNSANVESEEGLDHVFFFKLF